MIIVQEQETHCRKFVISRPVRQALLCKAQQGLLHPAQQGLLCQAQQGLFCQAQQALLCLKQYRGMTIENQRAKGGGLLKDQKALLSLAPDCLHKMG